jgi:hypothetical protein
MVTPLTGLKRSDVTLNSTSNWGATSYSRVKSAWTLVRSTTTRRVKRGWLGRRVSTFYLCLWIRATSVVVEVVQQLSIFIKVVLVLIVKLFKDVLDVEV